MTPVNVYATDYDMDNGCNCGSDEACGHGEEPMSMTAPIRRSVRTGPSLVEVMKQVRTRAESDALMADYDDAQRAYKFAVRIGMDAPVIEDAFAKWNDAREKLIGMLCGEAA